jgi:hypothetical protein
MIARTPRLLLAFASLLLTAGAAMHAAAFKRTLAAVATSDLRPFFGNSLKMLWLGDSATLFLLGALFALIAARPSVATRPVVMLLAFIPAATAVLIYVFLGSFFAGHLLMAIAAAAFFAGLQFPGTRVQAAGVTRR